MLSLAFCVEVVHKKNSNVPDVHCIKVQNNLDHEIRNLLLHASPDLVLLLITFCSG